MKAIIKSIRDKPCRVREISENEMDTFSDLSHVQRYFSALDEFNQPSLYFEKNLELPSRFQVKEWKQTSPDKEQSKIIKSIIIDNKTNETVNKSIFVKTVHLIDPVEYIKEYYANQSHSLMPYIKEEVEYTVNRIHSKNNQAYVDTIANYILSHFREEDIFPHFVEFYGNLVGISKSYNYNITDEYDSYKNKKWFWRGINKFNAKFKVFMDNENIETIEELKEIYDEIVTCPFNNSELSEEDNETCSISEIKELINIGNCDIQSIKSCNSMKTYEFESNSDSTSANENNNEEDDTQEDEEDDTELDIFLNVSNIPVIKIFQEAQEGTMDELLDEEVIDEQLRGTQGWEARWIAWLFQVVATLTFLQSTLSFTHNDLHSNNILWRKTDKKFIYYREKSGQIWRIPTYGKIFSIIDFGRSIFKLGKQQWISSDLYPENDAAEQYNFGPFYDKTKPKVIPNYSFDLARLSVSLLDGLFDEKPEKKKGKCNLMSESGDWKVYETKSPLFNLLWMWMVDDNNMTIYEDKDGEPRFPGFDLYIHIAHHLHNAVPKEQLKRTQFTQFKWNKKPAKGEKVYNLGI